MYNPVISLFSVFIGPYVSIVLFYNMELNLAGDPKENKKLARPFHLAANKLFEGN